MAICSALIIHHASQPTHTLKEAHHTPGRIRPTTTGCRPYCNEAICGTDQTKLERQSRWIICTHKERGRASQFLGQEGSLRRGCEPRQSDPRCAVSAEFVRVLATYTHLFFDATPLPCSYLRVPFHSMSIKRTFIPGSLEKIAAITYSTQP
jgi:hypothetical protein